MSNNKKNSRRYELITVIFGRQIHGKPCWFEICNVVELKSLEIGNSVCENDARSHRMNAKIEMKRRASRQATRKPNTSHFWAHWTVDLFRQTGKLTDVSKLL
jgi:hypothetical protein